MEQSDDANGKVAYVLRKSPRLNPNFEGSGTGMVTPSPPTTEVPTASQIGPEPPAPAALKSLPLKRKSQRPPPGGCDHDGRRRRSARLNPIEERPSHYLVNLVRLTSTLRLRQSQSPSQIQSQSLGQIQRPSQIQRQSPSQRQSQSKSQRQSQPKGRTQAI